MGKFELIDTLWNVNSKVFDEQVGQNIGINRYIMECKYIQRYTVHPSQSELIDTLWNVNIHCFQTIKIIVCELIDTLWNVNIGTTWENYYKEQELIDTLWNVN